MGKEGLCGILLSSFWGRGWGGVDGSFGSESLSRFVILTQMLRSLGKIIP